MESGAPPSGLANARPSGHEYASQLRPVFTGSWKTTGSARPNWEAEGLGTSPATLRPVHCPAPQSIWSAVPASQESPPECELQAIPNAVQQSITSHEIPCRTREVPPRVIGTVKRIGYCRSVAPFRGAEDPTGTKPGSELTHLRGSNAIQMAPGTVAELIAHLALLASLPRQDAQNWT